MRKLCILLFALILVLLLVAQERSGRIIGKVIDSDGNPIPGVTVTLLATTGAPIKAITTEEGLFRFLALLPSIGYSLKAELEGFKTKTETNIIVVARETTEVNLLMEMGDLVEITIAYGSPPREGLHKQMQLTKEHIEAFRSAKSVRIVVEQSYQDNRDKDLKNVHLPIEYVAEKFLKFIRLQVLSSDVRSNDLEIKIITKGTANVWYGKISPPAAKLTSEISFKIADVPMYAATIYNYSSFYRYNLYETISEPIKARRNPFSVDELAHELMSSFEGTIIELMVEIFGISPVIARLNDENVALRKYAAASLRHIRDQRGIEPLIACIDDEEKDVRVVAIKSLAAIDDQRAVETLMEALKHKDEAVRVIAAESLGYSEDERAVEPLIASLKDNNEHVRAAAAKSLGYIEDSRVVEPLKDALKDKDKDVRAAAMEALIREFDDPEKDDILKAALKDKDGIVRAIVLKEIWLLDDDKLAVEYLLAALTDKSEIVRATAAKSLDDYYDEPQVIEALIAALKDKDEIVRAAAVAPLGDCDDEPRAVESLIIALTDKSELVRATVLEVLRYSDNPRVVEALIATLKDKDENFRMYIDEILETITSNSFEGKQEKWQEWWKENKEDFIKKNKINQ